MGKIIDRMRKNREVHNPVTGAVFTKRERRMFKKYGVDEQGHLRSKYDTSNKINRLKRTEMRGEVRTIRAKTGNTFMNGVAKTVGAIMGHNEEEEPIYYENNPYEETPPIYENEQYEDDEYSNENSGLELY